MKKYSINKLILFIFFLCLYSCSQNIEEHLSVLKEKGYIINEKGWTIVANYSSEIEDYYGLKKNIKDTLIILTFSYFKDSINKGIYYVDNYSKTYFKDNYYYQLSLQKKDTLY